MPPPGAEIVVRTTVGRRLLAPSCPGLVVTGSGVVPWAAETAVCRGPPRIVDLRWILPLPAARFDRAVAVMPYRPLVGGTNCSPSAAGVLRCGTSGQRASDGGRSSSR